MGEYAIFVWPCYAATVVLLTIVCYSSWADKKKAETKLASLKDEIENLESQE